MFCVLIYKKYQLTLYILQFTSVKLSVKFCEIETTEACLNFGRLVYIFSFLYKISKSEFDIKLDRAVVRTKNIAVDFSVVDFFVESFATYKVVDSPSCVFSTSLKTI